MKRTFKQFHQYQQNEQSPLFFAGLTQKKKQHMTLEIQILAWDRYKHVTGLNRLMGPLLISNDNTYIKKRLKKTLHRLASTQKDHILSQNERQHEHECS